jgi:hypothetical protein
LLANPKHYSIMKKLIPMALFLAFFAVACEKVDLQEQQEEDLVMAPTERKCDADLVLQQQIQEDPSRGERLKQIEAYVQEYADKVKKGMIVQNATLTIPVYVNVVYNTAAQNIPQAQITSQIDILNRDFSATNSEVSPSITAFIPDAYKPLVANANIQFTLAGVKRVQTKVRSFRTNDDVKRTSRGGVDPTDPANFLNIWVCTLSNGILGYAQFPGGPLATDGVVCLNSAFGITSGNYGQGRTATHEVGHWLGLYHIWGDQTCGNDRVADTPPHNAANYGCPGAGHLSTCTNPKEEMWMNYMDYTYDRCMYMFTAGQSTVMNGVLTGVRSGWLN